MTKRLHCPSERSICTTFGRIALSCYFALDLLSDKAELYYSPFLRLAFAAALPVVRPLQDFEFAR